MGTDNTSPNSVSFSEIIPTCVTGTISFRSLFARKCLLPDTEHNKIEVIRKAKNLRDMKNGGWEKVFVHQDLIPKQREERNKLVVELKRRLASGEKDLVIYRGKIVKRRGC